MKFCENCGCAIEGEEIYCGNCGTYIGEENDSNNNENIIENSSEESNVDVQSKIEDNKVIENEVPKVVAKRPMSKRNKIIALIIAILLIGGGATYYIMENFFYKVSFIVKSNVDDVDVYVDDKKTGKIKDGKYKVNNIKWHTGMKVYLVQEFGDKTKNASDKYTIEKGEYKASDIEKGSDPLEISLELPETLSKDDAQEWLEQFYSMVSSGYNDGYEYSTANFLRFFEENEKNKDYQDFIGDITAKSKNKKISSINIDAQIEDFKQISKDKYEISYIITYKTSFSDFEKDDLEEVFRYKKVTLKGVEKKSDNSDEYSSYFEPQFRIIDMGGQKNHDKIKSES